MVDQSAAADRTNDRHPSANMTPGCPQCPGHGRVDSGNFGPLSLADGGTENAGVENAEVENAAPNCRTGKRGKRHVWKAKRRIFHM